MTDLPAKPAFGLREDEKLTRVMIYTPETLLAGELYSKLAVRVATWLRSTMLPSHLTMYEARVLHLGGPKPIQMTYSRVHIPVSLVLAYHVLPPETVDRDYDLNEPNRVMYPIVATIGPYRIAGEKRISSLSDFTATLDLGKEIFIPIYDAQLSVHSYPEVKGFQAPYVLVRQDRILYTEAL